VFYITRCFVLFSRVSLTSTFSHVSESLVPVGWSLQEILDLNPQGNVYSGKGEDIKRKNIRFRALIHLNYEAYANADNGKRQIKLELYELVCQGGGRFLAEDEEAEADKTKSLTKIGRALTDAAGKPRKAEQQHQPQQVNMKNGIHGPHGPRARPDTARLQPEMDEPPQNVGTDRENEDPYNSEQDEICVNPFENVEIEWGAQIAAPFPEDITIGSSLQTTQDGEESEIVDPRFQDEEMPEFDADSASELDDSELEARSSYPFYDR